MSISIIMPARNSAKTIAESIDSILQCGPVSELIVINDGSVDETLFVIASVSDARLKIVQGKGRGISAALNLGIAASSCEFIARCDADDIYPSTRLGQQVTWLQQNPTFVAISGGFRTINASGRFITDLACDGHPRDVTDLLLNGTPVTHFGTWLTRRSALVSIGGAREWFQTAEDLDIMFRVANKGNVWHDPRVAYIYRLHDSSIVHSQPNAAREFFEQSAKRFAQLRASGELDPLENGSPPLVPTHAAGKAMPASEHARNLLVGAGWKAHSSGRKWEGVAYLTKALYIEPLSFSLWKQLFLVVFRPSP